MTRTGWKPSRLPSSFKGLRFPPPPSLLKAPLSMPPFAAMLHAGNPALMSDLIHGPMYRILPIILSLGLGACQTTPPPGAAQNLHIELVPKRGDTPPAAPPDACWASDTVPAVIETVTEQIRAQPERRAPDGRVIQPAVFRTETRQRIVSDRREVWFRTPCAAEQTVEFIASVQRALKARGFYLAPVTGALDAATAEAIRRYQAPLGLDSPVLALTTARALGISASDLGR